MRALASVLGVVFLVASVGAADADNKGKGNSSKNSGPAIKFVSAFKAPQRPGHSNKGGHHGKWDDWKKHKWPSKGPKHCKDDDDALEMIGWGFGHDRGEHKGWSKAKYCPKPPVSPPGHGGGHGHGHQQDWWDDKPGKGKGHVKYDNWAFNWRW